MNEWVTVIVVNYNSANKWNIVEYCLRRILSLEYKPLEIIVVDNGSTDGSYELIRNTIDKVPQSKDFKIKVIRLSKNYGFAIANIIAYTLRSSQSKYVALINNDLAPEPRSLNRLIDILKKHPKIAGVQGIILSWDKRCIDSYGGLVTQHGVCYAVGFGLESTHTRKLRPIITTYIDGAFSVYRIEALEGSGGLFLPYFFMWGDDYELGIRLWRSGWILVAVPIVVGRHYRGASTQLGDKRSLLEPPKLPYMLEYWSWVSNIAVAVVLYGHPWILRLMERIPLSLTAALLKRSKAILRGFIDGIIVGVKLRRKLRKYLREVKEPRLRVNVIKELALTLKLYMRYGIKASRIYYLLVSRSLGARSLKH